MKAIVLGAGRGVNLRLGGSTPKCLLEGLAGWRVLDWLLNALREGGEVDDFVFVGGDAMDRVQEAYPQLRFVHNPRWAEEHVVGSLFAAESELHGPFWFTYSDIVYRPDVAARLREAQGDIVLVVDRAWRDRYADRRGHLLDQAEKVVLRGDRVRWIGKQVPQEEDVAGEFIGLARFSERGAAALRSAYQSLAPLYRHRPYRDRLNLHDGHLTDLLQELIDQGAVVNVVMVDGDYAELDVPSDLTRFVFGTKGETLERLRPLLSRAHVTEGVNLRVGEWIANPTGMAAELSNRFGGESLAIRSSAKAEDRLEASQAGRYESVIGVASDDVGAIAVAVEQVVASYERDGRHEDDQILVQPCLTDVVMSGVMMTRDLDTGADYMVVHYDDATGRTDAVTSGQGDWTRAVKIYRGRLQPPADERLAALVATAAELESITGSDALDVEFAFTRDEQLHVLQVRPIAAARKWTVADPHAVQEELHQVRDFLQSRQRPVSGLGGATTLLGQMPDWNPAEMIGTHPHELARTLYEYLITDSAWNESRARLGYADAFAHPLMVTIAGRPYVDVRLSFNNLLPARLAPDLRGRVIDAALRRLEANPHLHDKVEFEVLPTAWDFDVDRVLDRLAEQGLPSSDRETVERALFEHTRELVRDGRVRIAEFLERTATLAPVTDALVADEDRPVLDRVAELLALTRRDGTEPFAALARLAFVGTSLLRSLRARSVWKAAREAAFLSGVRTVSTEMVEALAEVQSGNAPLESFLERFGHLRPGSYDLLSPRYDQDPHLYFPPDATETSPVAHEQQASEPVSSESKARVDALLHEHGLGFDADHLFAFIREAIAARELAKFRFTRALSAGLELLAEFGESLGLSREETVHLDVKSLLGFAHRPLPAQLEDRLVRRISRTRMQRERHAKILLPVLITGPEDLEMVRPPASRPNFVTSGRVAAPVVRVDAGTGHDAWDLAGRIAVIEGADPGYDWIFTRGIAGLITRFGGANSHMTIRCAEFGLPAAIGCGDGLFERVTHARSVELDCGGETIRVLG